MGNGSPVRRGRRGARAAIGAALALLASTLPVAGSAAAAPAPTPAAHVRAVRVVPARRRRVRGRQQRLGGRHRQCIEQSGARDDSGFVIDTAEHVNTTGPAGYPSIYRGCVYGYCTCGSPFPRRVDQSAL